MTTSWSSTWFARFRYDSEGGGAGVLYGETSTTAKKTFPKIKVGKTASTLFLSSAFSIVGNFQVLGCSGPAMVVVSCVTHDSEPPKAHPHTLISRANVSWENIWPLQLQTFTRFIFALNWEIPGISNLHPQLLATRDPARLLQILEIASHQHSITFTIHVKEFLKI